MPVEPDELICRFAVDKSYFRASDNTAKGKAFLPNRDGDTSVFRISGLPENEKWALGTVNVADPQGKQLRASIEIEANHILNSILDIDPNDNPPRHANIHKWPAEKSARLLIANELAGKSKLNLFPT